MRRAFNRVQVWDVPTRLFHWLLAFSVLLAWWSELTDQIGWHKLSGYAVAALIIFRVFWGFCGSETSRFGDFIKSPSFVMRYAQNGAWKQVGHNPLGGYSVLAMLGILLVQVALGLLSVDQEGLESGPLAYLISPRSAHLVTQIHGLVFNAILGLIALHIGAVGLHAMNGKNLVKPMIDGMASIPLDAKAPQMASRKIQILGLMLGLAVLLLLLLIGE